MFPVFKLCTKTPKTSCFSQLIGLSKAKSWFLSSQFFSTEAAEANTMGFNYLTLKSASTVVYILKCFLLHFTHPKFNYNGVKYSTYLDINLSIVSCLYYNVLILEGIGSFQVESHLLLVDSENQKFVIGPEPWLVPGPESRDFLVLKASIGLGNSELKTSPKLGSYTPVP